MTDIILDEMKKSGLPMTRDQYLALAYLGNPPDELGEDEQDFPEEFKQEPQNG